MMPLELTRNNLVLTRVNGTIEHSVFVRDGDGSIMHLVHLAVTPSGHATVVDYDTHVNSAGEKAYHHEDSPAVIANKVRLFLDLDGHKMLGHPNSPLTGAAEVA